MYIFGLDNQGCMVEANTGQGKGKRGAIITFGSALTDNTLVTKIDIGQKERLAVIACFDDRNYVYAFGHNAAESVLDVTLMMSISAESDALKREFERYEQNRVSKGKLVKITYGSTFLLGYLIEMRSGTVNTELNLQSMLYRILLPKCVGAK